MPATMGPNKEKKSSSNEPQMSFQEGVNAFAHHAQHFGEAMQTAFNPQQMAQMNNGLVTNVQSRPDGDVDISVDIPINHSGTTTTTTTTSTNNNGATTNKTVYPDLEKNQMEEDFTPVSTEDAKAAKLNEAMKKMNQLGFEGEGVEALLQSVDCDIARAVDNLNPKMN